MEGMDLDASCQVDSQREMYEIGIFFQNAGNSFINQNIEVAKNKFVETVSPLHRLMVSQFDKWPYRQIEDNFTIQLQPSYIHSTPYKEYDPAKREKWIELEKQLHKLLVDLETSYKSFRRVVKSELFV